MKFSFVSAVAAAVVLMGLSGCDRIKSLWTSEDAALPGSKEVAQPAPAPAEASIELARPAAAPKVAADEDSLLAERVKSALGDDPDLRLLAIDASASGGAVTLHGTANTIANREKAARVASAVAGVRSVKNQLVIVAGS